MRAKNHETTRRAASLGIFLLSALVPFVSTAAPDTRGGLVSKADAIADIHYALTRAEAVHPNLYWYIDRQSVQAREDAIIAALPDPASTMDVYLALSEITGMLGDGHVTVSRPKGNAADSLSEDLKSGGFLLAVYVEPDVHGLRVVDSELGGVGTGDMITSINGHDANDIFNKVVVLQSGEPAFKLLGAEANFPQALWDFGIRAPFALAGTFAGKPGQVTISRSQRRAGHPNHYLAPEDQGIAGELAADGIYVIKFASMTADREKFRARLAVVFNDIAIKRPRGLIVDIRQNLGGNSGLGDDLLSYFNSKEYRPFAREVFRASAECRAYFGKLFPDDYTVSILKELHDGEEKAWSVPVRMFDRSFPQFRGPVAFLIGPGTFSSGNILANSIGDFHLAKLIGNDTAERPNNYGQACPITLPHTGIEVSVPSTYFVRANGDDSSVDDVHPDISVPARLGLAPRDDIVMAAARRWVLSQPTKAADSGQDAEPAPASHPTFSMQQLLAAMGIGFGVSLTQHGIGRFTRPPWNKSGTAFVIAIGIWTTIAAIVVSYRG
jgi:C-terminal processing protease CtpA/Prc